MGQAEKRIENEILKILKLSGVFAWKCQTVGIFDPKKKIFRRNTNPFHIKGVADILGIYKGQPLAIEVKSITGRLSPDQKLFLETFRENGGISLVARSVDDVIKGLGLAVRY